MADLAFLLQAIIAFCAVFSALGLLFSVLLGPIKKDIAKLEAGQAKLEAGQVKMEAGLSAIQSELQVIKKALSKS